MIFVQIHVKHVLTGARKMDTVWVGYATVLLDIMARIVP